MLATLGKLKPMLFLTSDEEDDQLTMLLATASGAIEAHCQRSFALKEYSEIRSGDASAYLALRNYPIREIKEITPAPDKFITLDGGILYSSTGWERGEYNITLKYVGGYQLPSDDQDAPPSDLPPAVETACLMLAKMMYKGEWGKTSERLENYSANYAQAERPDDLPPVIQALCAPHVWRLG